MRLLALDRAVERAVRPVSARTVRIGGGTLVSAVGAALLAVLVSRTLSGYSNLLSLLLRSALDAEGGAHVLLWWAVGTAVASTTGVAVVVFERANDVVVTEPAVVLAGNAATGGLGGLIVGYFAARRLAVAREVAVERERLADEREKMALINRIVRHDIGNDLQVISASADYLDGHVDEQGGDALERLQRTAAEAVDLTEQVRTFVQALDDDSVERRPIALRRILETQVDNARERHPAVTIRLTDIPNVEVIADELLSSVVHNLVSNAITHNDSDDPLVELSAEATAETVRLRVADNGPGIPEDRKDELFDRGQKGEASAGTGIGLYIVETLVDRYGGDVWVEDNDPRGAVFVVELPREESSEEGAESEPVQSLVEN